MTIKLTKHNLINIREHTLTLPEYSTTGVGNLWHVCLIWHAERFSMARGRCPKRMHSMC